MRDLARRTVVATVGAIALGCVGSGSAAAADAPAVRGPQPPPAYYGEQDYIEEGYAVRPPPAVYVYPPPPVYRYYYGPPSVVVVPGPYYGRPYYGAGYGGPPYFRRYAPYVARGYGPYGRPWGPGYYR